MKFAFALLLALCISAPAQAPFGRRAPGFSLMDPITLKQHDLQDYRGKVVLIDIMRTNCPHCQELTKTLEQVKAKFGDKIQILSIVNPPDNQTTIRKYIADYKVTNPFLYDCGQMAVSYLQIGPSNPTVNVPRLFLIDKTGLIRKDIAENAGGGFSLQNLTTSVDALVK